MRYLLVLISALFLSGCFDPTLDTSTAETAKQSYNELLQSLPEEERGRFDALVISYLEEYEIAGNIQQNDLSELDGLTADEIYEVANEHSKRIDKFIAEEMAAYDDYMQHKEEKPEKFSSPNVIGVSKYTKSVASLNLKYINIRSLVDIVEIQSVSANRGNCTLLYKDLFPTTIKYGETFDVMLNNDCDVIEAVIVTNHGAGTYTFY